MNLRHVIASSWIIMSAYSVGAKDKTATSWAKKSITYDQYKNDALTCAKFGYFRDVSNDEPAKRFVRGFQTADDNLNRGGDSGSQSADSWSDTMRRTQPSRRMREVQEIQVADVEKCLSEKGYIKFTLSKYEASKLSKYKVGSEDRKLYLYMLSMKDRKQNE